MTEQEFAKLRRGDVIMNQADGLWYVVERKIPGRNAYILVRTRTAAKPDEWRRVPRERLNW